MQLEELCAQKPEGTCLMFNLLYRIPAEKQKATAHRLLPAAGIAAAFAVFPLIAGVSGSETVEECSGRLIFRKCKDVTTVYSLTERVLWIALALGLFALAAVMLVAAWRLLSIEGRLNRYLAILTGVESLSVERIAEITRSRPSKVRAEIQSMINAALISDFYIDYSDDRVYSRKYLPKTSYKTVVKCSECGGNNELIVGITKPCSFCGQPLLLGSAQAT